MSNQTIIHSLVATGGNHIISLSWAYTDPNAGGSVYTTHYYSEVQISTSSDMSSPTIEFIQGSTYYTTPASAGQTLYFRVRSRWHSSGGGFGGSGPGEAGPWSSVVSATETSDPSDPWEEAWADFTFEASLESGTITIDAVEAARYVEMGKTVFFIMEIDIHSTSGGAGFTRFGAIPVPLKSGGNFSVSGKRAGSGNFNVALTGRVVDLGGGEAGVDLYKYDGSFAPGDLSTLYVSGFYEAA